MSIWMCYKPSATFYTGWVSSLWFKFESPKESTLKTDAVNNTLSSSTKAYLQVLLIIFINVGTSWCLLIHIQNQMSWLQTTNRLPQFLLNVFIPLKAHCAVWIVALWGESALSRKTKKKEMEVNNWKVRKRQMDDKHGCFFCNTQTNFCS